MLSHIYTFFGVLLLINAAQVKGFEYLEDVIARAQKNMASYESGKDIEKALFESKSVTLDLGDLNNETFPLLSENQKVAIAGCHKLLLKNADKSGSEILPLLMQNALLQPKTDHSIKRLDKFLEVKSWWNIFGGKSDATKQSELDDWISKLVSNPKFLAATHLRGDSSINIAKATLIIFEKLRSACNDKGAGNLQRDIVNLVVLQYPQTKSSSLVLRQVRIFGWVDCSDSDHNGGVTGEYSKSEFTPRDTIISSMAEEVRERAVDYIEAIFDEIEPKDKTPTVSSVQYLEDVIIRARKNLALYESGKDIKEPIFNSRGVALDIGNLNKETFPLLPDKVKISIASCHRVLIKSTDDDFEEIYTAMMRNPLLEPNTQSFIHRLDKFMPEVKSWWNIFGKSKDKTMKEMDDWFLKLIDDPEFLAATHLRGDSSVSMAKAATLLFEALRNACGGHGREVIKREIIDLALLQYPQAKNSTFDLHHVTLFAWVDCTTRKKIGGITGEYLKNQFKSRDEMISQMSPKSRERALALIGDIFEKIEPKNGAITKAGQLTTTPTTSSSTGSSGNPISEYPSTEAAFTTATTITKESSDDDVDNEVDDDVDDDVNDVCE